MNAKELLDNGYKIENAQITKVDLSMEDHACFVLHMELESYLWSVVYGGYKLGYGYLDSDTFEGYAKGLEYIMRVMDTVGVSKFLDMTGKYVRVATKGWGSQVKIIGNIIKDKWFDPDEFFAKKNGE